MVSVKIKKNNKLLAEVGYMLGIDMNLAIKLPEKIKANGNFPS
jgi:hypothetical protein